MKQNLKIFALLSGIVFLIFTVWWALLRFEVEPFGLNGDVFSDTYGVLALLGGFTGLYVSKKWGWTKSTLGKSLLAFSAGLLAQAFGQFVYSMYFFFLHTEVPYPSIGDIGYFGSVLLYIYGIFLLAKVSGAKLSLQLISSKFLALVIPLAILVASYVFFLKGYVFGESSTLATLLDFGYPLGQAIYISLAILTFMLSRKILGGIMRGRILFVLFALVVQYVADFTFLYKASRETWVAGGVSDFLYLVSYLVMTLALIMIGKVYLEVKEA